MERSALIAARVKHGLNQAELAAAVGCSQQMISAIEAGTRNPGIRLARLISDAVDEPFDVVFPDIMANLRALINNKSWFAVRNEAKGG